MIGRGLGTFGLLLQCLLVTAVSYGQEATGPAQTHAQSWSISPTVIAFDRPETTEQLLVTATLADGSLRDVTHTAEYRVADATRARVDQTGQVQPLATGETAIIVRYQGTEQQVTVKTADLQHSPPISFRNDIIPLLTKAGCNSGGCHGKAEGQNGFRLSVFGFDPAGDHDAFTKESRGRRVQIAAPEQSLMLLKGSAIVPHGGGQKWDPHGVRYQQVLRWIREGAALDVAGSEPVVRIEVEPTSRILVPTGQQQIRVVAIDAAGQRRPVTAEAEFESNAATVAEVDRAGLVRSTGIPGEAAILVRYLGQVALCRVAIPRTSGSFERPAAHNFIDEHVLNKLEQLRIPPSDLASDAAFLRRVYLDTTGTLPTAAEARAYLADNAPDKRDKLVAQLLQSAAYVDYWALRWSDILRVDRDRITPAGAVAMHGWLREQIEQNRPYDVWVRELLTAKGDYTSAGPAAFFRATDKSETTAQNVSQVFLGVRIECAQCHHHPFERWSQEDYFSWSNLFTGVKRKKLPDGTEAIVFDKGSDKKHPRTGLPLPARTLGGEPIDFDAADAPLDRRVPMANWLTANDNELFATMIVNRLWAHYFGRGLIEPIDDLRATNPATNEPLLKALIAELRRLKFDLRAFTQTLLASRTYQLASTTRPENVDDEQHFSHAMQKALPAEVLLDIVCQATAVPEKFNGWPAGYRAVQVWDNRMPSYFFQIFGRPVRATVCECERSNEPSIAQALHLLNSPEIQAKIGARTGTARRLAASTLPPREVIDELFLQTVSRLPTDHERAAMLALFDSGDRRTAVEDALWALLNTKEFLYNH